MKLHCETKEEKFERLWAKRSVWHSWFAWYPVRVAQGDCHWLECVERRYGYYSKIYLEMYGVEYRAK